MCVNRRFHLDADPTTPSHARQLLRGELTGLLAEATMLLPALSDAELATSELVSNAVRASPLPMTFSFCVHHTWLGLSVHDPGTGRPVLMDPEPRETHGRGLRIVDLVAQDWGVLPDPAGGKTVWASLGLPPSAAAHLSCHEPQPRPATGRAG